MSDSIIVYGGKKQDRLNKLSELLSDIKLNLSENNPDVLTISLSEEKRNISIDQIKEGNKYISKKPIHGKVKALIIDAADKINTEGQNALLKTLEEPPSYATIILLAKTQSSVLPTILSRCKRYEVGDKSQKTNKDSVLPEFMTKSIGERLTEVSELAKEPREECIKRLEDWLEELHDVIQGEHEQITLNKAAAAAKIINQVRRDLENTNVNLKLALEFLALSIS